ncbi:MAG: hypothetical protein GTO31_13450, partial [Xanthomonadales bacterium]|nr:hypothetical protein [Xanthomonadales bacterium]
DKDEAERLEEERRETVSMDDLRAEIVRLEGELEEQPEHVNRILGLARLYQDTAQYDKALEFLKEKHELLPDNYEVR